jgi:RND family efflux transporter MFP subunit
MQIDDAMSPKPVRLKRIAVVVVVIAVLLAAAGISTRAYEYRRLTAWTAANDTPTVDLIRPQAQTGAHAMSLPGHLEAWTEAPIHARVSGYLKSWAADIGTRVVTGQELAVIETPELDQELARAKANLLRARKKAALASITTRRWQNLLSSHSVSKQEADERRGESEVAEADVQGAQADVDRLEAMESFKHVAAPFSGIITNRLTDIGDLVTANNGSNPTLFTLASTSRLRLYVSIPQRFSDVIKPGLAVSLDVLEHPGKNFEATLLSSSGAVNTSSGAVLVQFLVNNKNDELMPGDYARVHIPLVGDPNLLTIPATALMFRAQGLQVAVLDKADQVVLRNIHIALDLGDVVQVDKGIAVTDAIIDHPPDSLSDGSQVKVAQNKATAADDVSPKN